MNLTYNSEIKIQKKVFDASILIVRYPGIEPGYHAWKAYILTTGLITQKIGPYRDRTYDLAVNSRTL